MKEKNYKFENDDLSRMAGPDFKEDHKSRPLNQPASFNGGISDELKSKVVKKDSTDHDQKVKKGPSEATIRDLGIDPESP